MKKILITILSIYFFTGFSLIGDELPVNALQKSVIGNWWYLGPLEKNTPSFDAVGKVEKDPLNYFNNNKNNDLSNKIINVSSSLKFGTQLFYQIYDNLNKGDVIYAFSYIESKKQLENIKFTVNGGAIHSLEVFINGKSLANHNGYAGEVDFNVDLKKGKNIVLIKIETIEYNPSIVNVFPRFFLWAMPEESVKIYGSVSDKDGNIIPNKGVQVFDGYRYYGARSDKNGMYELTFYPFQNSYQAATYDAVNRRNGYSKKVDVTAGKSYRLDIKANLKTKFYGTTKNVDGNTPQAGIRIRLESISGTQNYNNWTAISDENGYFSIGGVRNGKFYASYYSDHKRNFIVDKSGNKKVYNFTGDNKFEENITVSKQVKGSWKNINLFDGMLSSAVYDLLLATDGKLYIGTFNGLSIYDGQSVVSYNYKNGLPNDAIRCLFEDNENNIWLGYDFSGAVKWNNGDFEHFDSKNGLPGNQIFAINQDKDGNMLFGTDRGLCVYDGNDFKTYNYTNGLGNGSISAIEVDGKNIWIGQNWPAGMLTLFNGVTFKNFEIPYDHHYGMNITTLTMDNNGILWIGDGRKGLISYDGESFKQWINRDGLAGNWVSEIYIEDNNNIWIGTGNGVSVFDGNNFKTIHEFDNDLALTNGAVNSISKSKDGIYFFGQDNRGVIVYDPNSLRNIEMADGYKRGQTGRIRYDKNNNLWISQWEGNGGLQRIENEQIVEEINYNDGLPDSRVTDFDFTSDGRMWIGTPSGLAELNMINKKMKTYQKKEGLQNNNIRSLVVDENDIVWLYTPAGLIRFDGESFTMYTQEDGLVRPRGNGRVKVDKKGNIIYTTYGSGFSVFDGKDFKNYDKSNGMVDGRIWDIGVDSKNNYWLALDGSGVQMFDGENFIHYDVEDGVGAGETWSVFVDDFDIVWIGTFHGGACMFDGDNWNCIDKRDGLVDNTISSIFGTNGNKVWLGGLSGITTYIPKREVSQAYLKRIITPQKVYSGKEILNSNYEIEIGNRITFGLNSNSFNTLEEKQKYIVTINHNNTITDTLINSNSFNFIGSTTGDYNLSFKSIDRDLNYSNPANIKFSVVGPWYTNPVTAIPFWGFIVFMLSFSGYTTNKYFKQRRVSLQLREEAAEKDRIARINLEGKNEELQESQKVAEAANAAKSTFLANMSHELRTPLNAIIGYSEMLMEDAEDENEDFIPDLDKINNSGKHLLGLINDILDLSKVESGKMELFIEEFDLKKVVGEIEATIKPLIEKNKNSLKIDYISSLEKMTADVTKIRQILLNLLSNSAKFTKEGTITITVDESKVQDKSIDFIISDTGIGMTPDQVDKVFKPFTQADEKTTRKFGGTGLGLTITKMFAEMMGGDIGLTSEESKGTTFTVTIPLEVVDKKKQNEVELITRTSGQDSNYRVLVIDDDDNAQDMMRKFLEKQNVSILQARTGEDGLKLAAQHLPDVITLDVMMPEMDGWEVLAALQANEVTKNIPVIMLTMADEPDIGYSLGATDYLTKPVNWDELSNVLTRHKIESDSQTILIVEDDETTRDMLRKSLETNDFRVRSAVNGKEALLKVQESKPGLILLDLMMPEMDGFEFAEKLRENKDWLDIPVVVITAKDLTKEDHQRLKGNVEAIMQKGSYSKNELLTEVGERIKQLKTRS